MYEKIKGIKEQLNEFNRKIIEDEVDKLLVKEPKYREVKREEVQLEAETMARVRTKTLGVDIKLPFEYERMYG